MSLNENAIANTIITSLNDELQKLTDDYKPYLIFFGLIYGLLYGIMIPLTFIIWIIRFLCCGKCSKCKKGRVSSL